MQFIKTLMQNFGLIIKMGYNDFRNKFASTNLGVVWGFIQPIIFMVTYVFVFEFILKTKSSGDVPFIVWFVTGIVMWMFINDAILNGSNSIRNYSYLVKKVVFPIDIIPLITLVSCFIVGVVLFLFAVIISLCFGIFPNVIEMFYIIFAAVIFIIAITRLSSALVSILADFSNLISIGMQLLFWFTPIMWNINMLSGTLANIVLYNPLAYLIYGFREAFTGGVILSFGNIQYTIVFWVLTILIFFYGNYIFNKNKKEFADII